MASTSSVSTAANKKNIQTSNRLNEKDSQVYNHKDLFLPKNRVSYFVYKPARTLPPNSPLHVKIFNYAQLIYYKYQLSTGLYMMNERERSLINFLVLASVALTFYHFIL